MKKLTITIWIAVMLAATAAIAALSGTTVFDGLIKIRSSPNASLTCATSTAVGELCVSGDIESNGNLDIAGTATLTGVVTMAGQLVPGGGILPNVTAITGVSSLTAAMCGDTITVSAGIDTASITLPEASTVLGCRYKIMYIGADGGALLDITPLDTDADGIEGGCTLAASVVTFSGTADADIGLTKTTGLTGDFIELTSCGAAMWCVTGCNGIWANN